MAAGRCWSPRQLPGGGPTCPASCLSSVASAVERQQMASEGFLLQSHQCPPPPAPISLASSFPPQSGGNVPVGNMASNRPLPPGVNCLQRGVAPPFYLAHYDSTHSAAPPWTRATTAALKCRREGRRFTPEKETRLLQVSRRRDRIKTSCGPAHPPPSPDPPRECFGRVMMHEDCAVR